MFSPRKFGKMLLFGKSSSRSLDDDRFCVIDLPEEVQTQLLSSLNVEQLYRCRQVCRLWHDIIDNQTIWRLMCERHNYAPTDSQKVTDYEMFFYRHYFNINLLKNWNGQENLQHWNVVENNGNGFTVESKASGSDNLNTIHEIIAKESTKKMPMFSCPDLHLNWATSYGWCRKEQFVDLRTMKCPKKLMQKQPAIEVSEWTSCRFDCPCVYELKVSILKSDKKTILDKIIKERKVTRETLHEKCREWVQIKHVFRNYGKGAAYVRFHHGGKDLKFWQGHYGPKMAAPCVRILIE